MPMHMHAGTLPPVSLAALLGGWQWRPVGLAVLCVLAACYLLAAGRAARSTAGWSAGRTVAFLAGLALLAFSTMSGVERYSGVLEWVHMIQHLLLIMFVPPLLALGSPFEVLVRAWPGRFGRSVGAAFGSHVGGWLTSPVFALVLYTTVIAGTHLTGFMDRAMSDPTTHRTEQVLYLLSGYLVCQLVFGVAPWRTDLSPIARMFLLALTMPVDTFTGVTLMQTSSVDPGMAADRPSWALSAVDDTHLAGAIMWVGGDGLMAVLAMLVLAFWTRSPQRALGGRAGWLERARQETFAAHVGAGAGPSGSASGEAAPPPGAADLDEGDAADAALAAYNAWLGRLAARDRQR